jgi:transcriptional/translational regulatory protein YebC/TACO1
MSEHSKWATLQQRERAQRRRRALRPALAPAGDLESVRYEGYGPGGAAVMVDCLTADRDRSLAEVRRVFMQHGGYLGAHGSVSYLFHSVGLMSYPPGTDTAALTRLALTAGAEEVVPNADHSVEVLADPLEFAAVRTELTEQGFAPATAEITERVATTLALTGAAAEEMMQLLAALESLGEVRDVYSNAEIPGELLARW